METSFPMSKDAIEVLDVSERDNILSFLPVAHSFERTAGYYAVTLAGGTIAYAEGLAQIPANLQEIKPTLVLVVPRLVGGDLRAGAQDGSEQSPASAQTLQHGNRKPESARPAILHRGKADRRRCSRCKWRFSASSCFIA